MQDVYVCKMHVCVCVCVCVCENINFMDLFSQSKKDIFA